MKLSEEALDYLEAHIPELAQVAFTQAYWAALASGSSVLMSEGGNLVEIFPDGKRKFIKKLPPRIPVTLGKKTAHPMNNDPLRLRMFAGPNGSGKSTFKTMLRRELLGVYINPDDIEKEISDRGFLDLDYYEVKTEEQEILDFFKRSPLLELADCLEEAQWLRFNDDKLSFHDVGVNAYFASVAADFIRQKLIETSKSFTFETVMSFPDKVELLRKAQARG